MKLPHIFLLIAVVAVWGINFVFIKIGLRELPPIFLCFCRFFLVGLPVLFFKRPAVPFRWVITYSLVMFVLQFTLMFSALHVGISAGLASIILQTQAFFSLLFAALFLKEKLNLSQILGSLVSFLGIALVGFNLGASVTLPGLLLVLGAAATWGGGSVIVKRMGKTSAASLLVWSSLLAWPPLLLISLFFEQSAPLLFYQWTSPTYLAIAFITIFSTVFAFGTWNWLLQLYPVSTVAPFTLLVPIFGMLGSILFLGENLEGWKIFSALLVISGLCINLLGPRLKSRETA